MAKLQDVEKVVEAKGGLPKGFRLVPGDREFTHVVRLLCDAPGYLELPDAGGEKPQRGHNWSQLYYRNVKDMSPDSVEEVANEILDKIREYQKELAMLGNVLVATVKGLLPHLERSRTLSRSGEEDIKILPAVLDDGLRLESCFASLVEEQETTKESAGTEWSEILEQDLESTRALYNFFFDLFKLGCWKYASSKSDREKIRYHLRKNLKLVRMQIPDWGVNHLGRAIERQLEEALWHWNALSTA